MKALKIVSLLLLTLSFTHCKTVKLIKNPPFKISGATYNNWVGGQPGVSGVKVIIGVVPKQDITFETLYFYNKTTRLEKKTIDTKQYLIGHIDTSTRKKMNRIIENPSDKKELVKLESEKFPFILKENEAVISYKKGNKTFYYKVSNIKMTKTVVYP